MSEINWGCFGIATLQTFGFILLGMVGLAAVIYMCYILDTKVRPLCPSLPSIPRKVGNVITMAFACFIVLVILLACIIGRYEVICK